MQNCGLRTSGQEYTARASDAKWKSWLEAPLPTTSGLVINSGPNRRVGTGPWAARVMLVRLIRPSRKLRASLLINGI